MICGEVTLYMIVKRSSECSKKIFRIKREPNYNNKIKICVYNVSYCGMDRVSTEVYDCIPMVVVCT